MLPTRIHWQNLVNFGVLALEFGDASDYDRIDGGDVLALRKLSATMRSDDRKIEIENTSKNETYELVHHLSPQQVKMVLAGGLIPLLEQELDK